MSSRALAKQLQEIDDLKRKNAAAADEHESEGEDEEAEAAAPSSGKKKFNPFAVLQQEDGDDEQAVEDDAEGAEEETESAPTQSNKSKKAAKKKKKKKDKGKGKAQAEDDEGEDGAASKQTTAADTEDIDAVIREYGYTGPQRPVSGGDASVSMSSPLLQVNAKFFNPDSEMRRMFGAASLREGTKTSKKFAGHHRSAVPRRSIQLVRGRDEWPRIPSGIDMEFVGFVDGCNVFQFVYGPLYLEAQAQYYACVETMDPQTLYDLAQRFPYHVDTLLQLSEVCKSTGSADVGAQLVERALFAYERALHQMFNPYLGNCRLPYSIPANRPFYTAIFRHIQFLATKGAHRTAMEFCKLLLSLDPTVDPLGALLIIDFMALRAKEYQYIVQLSDDFSNRPVHLFPNIAFSTALALHYIERQSEGGPSYSKSVDVMTDVLLKFPFALGPLLSKANVTLATTTYQPSPEVESALVGWIVADQAPLTAPSGTLTIGSIGSSGVTMPTLADIARHQYFTTTPYSSPALHTLMTLHAERNGLLWRDAEVQSWLRVCACRAVASVLYHKDNTTKGGNTKSVHVSRVQPIDSTAYETQQIYTVIVGPAAPHFIHRHVLLSDMTQSLATLPAYVRECPPHMYDYVLERQADVNADNSSPLMMFFRSLLPWVQPARRGGGPNIGNNNNNNANANPQFGVNVNVPELVGRAREALQAALGQLNMGNNNNANNNNNRNIFDVDDAQWEAQQQRRENDAEDQWLSSDEEDAGEQ